MPAGSRVSLPSSSSSFFGAQLFEVCVVLVHKLFDEMPMRPVVGTVLAGVYWSVSTIWFTFSERPENLAIKTKFPVPSTMPQVLASSY